MMGIETEKVYLRRMTRVLVCVEGGKLIDDQGSGRRND